MKTHFYSDSGQYNSIFDLSADVKKGQVNLSPFRTCREEFLNYFHGKEINKSTLNEFIDRYGDFVIDTITVGGSLYRIETGTTDFLGHQEEKKDNAGVGGKKVFVESGGSLSGL